MLAATDARAVLAAYARLGRELSERVLPLVVVLAGQAATATPISSRSRRRSTANAPSAPATRRRWSRSASACAPASKTWLGAAMADALLGPAVEQ
jgi:hypothetical protein